MQQQTTQATVVKQLNATLNINNRQISKQSLNNCS